MHMPPTLDEIEHFQQRLDKGFAAISRRAFRAILAHTLGQDDDYADRCLASFRANPLAYCMGRNPRSQGEMLYQAALHHIRVAYETGRPIGCPGPGRCHETGGIMCAHCGDVRRVCDAPETCEFHYPFTDERVRATILNMVTTQPGESYRRRCTIPRIVEGVLSSAGYSVAPPTEEQVLDILWAMFQAGEVERAPGPEKHPEPLGLPANLSRAALDTWDGRLQVPLPPQAPGEHGKCCPVTKHYWDPDPLLCDPTLCDFVSLPAAQPVEEDEDAS